MVSHHLLFSIESEMGIILFLSRLNAICTMTFSVLLRNLVIKLFLLQFVCLSLGKTNVTGGVYRIA